MDILKEVLDSMPNSKELELDDVLKNIPSDGSELFDLHKQTYSLNPQQEAEYLKLAQRMEIPKQAVVNNYNAIKAEIETPDESFWQEYERKHPKSAEFFKNSENHSIFRDKFKALADIEKATQENSLVKDVLKSFAAGSASLSAGMWRSGELINDTMEELGPMASKLSFLDSKQMKVLTGFMKVLGNKEAERAKELTPESYTGDVVGELGKGNIKEGSKQLTLALANNAPQMIGMLMGGASGYGVAASMASGLSQAGNTYTESEDSKASRGNKIVHAWGTAAVEAATEQLGTLSVFGSKSFDPLLAAMGKESRKKIIYEGLKGVGKEGFSEGIEELVSELYQTSSSWALNIEDNAFDGLANRAANSFTIGFASGASMRSPVALMESRGRYLDLKDHEGNINTLQKIMNTVKDSELNTRSADSIESFVKTAINENAKDISKIYVDSDVLNQYFQKNPDIDQDAILKELGIDEQVAEANVYGGDIEINTEKLARVAETGIFEQLKEDIKTKPDKLSSNQNRELEEVINGRINEAEEAVNIESERIAKVESDYNLIEEEIYKKLTEAGQKNELAKANASVFAKEFAAMARMDNKDLLEFYNEVAPQIVFGDSDVRAESSFEQSAYHGSPYRFDKFSNKKIGDGTGQQRYGWGLYFTENKDIAETYRGENGQLFEVQIPEKENLLDWNKPFKDQSPSVQSKIAPLLNEMGVKFNENTEGEFLYVKLGPSFESEQALSLKLKELGIEGITYKDHNANLEGKDVSNFVVFDDSLVNIENTYYQSKRKLVVQNEVLLPETVRVSKITPSKDFDLSKDITSHVKEKLSPREIVNKHSKRKIKISKNSSGKIISELIKRRRGFPQSVRNILHSIDSIDSLIQNAVFYKKPEVNETGRDFDHYYSLVNIDGKELAVQFQVERNKGNELYNIKIAEVNRGVWSNKPNGLNSSPTESVMADTLGESQDSKLASADHEPPSDLHASSVNLSEFEEKIKRAEKESFFQSDSEDQTPQGRFDVYKDGQTIIRLFKSANASTFLHETGHFWLNHIHSRVVSGTANEAQLKMWNTVSNYLGIPEGSNEITVEQHEKFARAREQYFREGNTPIKGLKNVFRKFSNWLKAIYKTAQELDVEVTPEIREFMDSMLQSEVLVAQAKADAGLDIGSLSKLNPEELTPEIRLKIDQLEERAKEIAEEKLVRKQLKAMSADRKKAISDAVENKRKEITEEVNNSDYALFLNEVSEGLNVKDIRSHAQKLVDGQLNEAQETLFEMIAEQEGLSSASHLAQEILKGAPIKEIINQEVNKFKAELEADGSNVALASEARRIVRSEQQVEIKAIESEVLFEMINDRTEAELDRIERELEAGNDKLLLQWVEDQAKHETETKLKGKFEAKLEKVEAKGEAKLQKQQQRSDAKIQKLNEDYERLKERSAYKLKEQKTREIWKRAIEAKTKEDKLRIFKEGREQLKKDITDLAKLESITVQSAARNKIAKMAISDINSQKYFIAHRNAALKTQTALKNGDIKKAYEFKRQEMLNLALAKESVRVKREADKIKDQLFKERKAKVESYKHEDHFHQVASILGRFGFAKTNYNRPANTMTLAQWKAQYDGQFDLYSIPQTIMNESITKSQDSLTIEDLRDIKNAIKNIRELANSKDRVLSLTSGLTLEGIKQELKDAGRKSTKKKKIVRRGDSKADKALNALDKYFSSLTKIDTYLQALDGFKDGPWQKYFKGIIDKAQDAESREKGILLTNIQKLYSIYDKKELKELSKKKFINEFGNTFMKSELIAMALNLGNVSNKEKLLGKPPVGVDSSNWNEQVLMSVLQNELTEKDWKFVQDSWDLVNSYWPRVADLHRDVTGFTPEKIEATPFQVVSNGKVIDLRGGYYPLKKDSRESQVANEQEISTELRQEMPTYVAKTKQGHLEARVDAEYSVSLSLNVMNRHLLNVVHDLTHRKAVIDLRKILNDKEIEQVLRDKIGVEGVNEIHNWLKAVANNSSVDNPIDSFYEKAVRFIRKRTGAVVLLWRFGVLAQNSANMFLFSGGVDGFSNKDALSAVAKYGLASYYPAIANPKKRQEIEAFVFSKSAFMKDKAETPEFTIAELTNKAIGLEEGSKIMELGGNMMAFTDQLINIPIWLGAYHKGLSEGKTEEQAIRQADLLIERSTGSGRKVDQASIMRGSEIDKLFSMFYSFLSVEYNRWSVEAQKAGHNGQAMDFAKFAGFATQRLLVFNIISLVLSGKLFGLEDEEEMAKTVLANTLLYPVSFFPMVRDVASLGVNMLLDIDDFGYRPSPAFNSIDQFYRTGKTFKSYLEGTKDEKELAESFTKAGAYIFGYPDAFNANAWNAYDIMFEGMTPQVTDIYRRRPKKERK